MIVIRWVTKLAGQRAVRRSRSNFRSNRKYSLAGKARSFSKMAGRCSVSVVLSPTAGADTEILREGSGERRLILKARLQRNVDERDGCFE
jgi:hypothetical protein